MHHNDGPIKFRPKRGQDASITKVAEVAGVSTATVSRVINQPHLVNEKTREKVQTIMDELQFRLNPAASALRRGHGKVITVLAASLAQPWYTKLMRALKGEIESHGFTMVQVDLQHDSYTLQQSLLPNSQQLPTGLILATGDLLNDNSIVSALEKAQEAQPIVVIGQYIEGASWPTVQFTDEEWAFQAVLGMIADGGNVAFLGKLGGSYLAEERLAGYLRAAQVKNFSTRKWVWPINRRDYEEGLNVTSTRIQSGETPDAIFAINDELALGASRALITAGLAIPQDVAVMGFGNTDFLDYVTPTLSSVDGSATDAARTAVDALWAQFEDKPYPSLTVLDRTIIHRESTKEP